MPPILNRLLRLRKQIFTVLSTSPGTHFRDCRFVLVRPVQTLCGVIPVERDIKKRPFQICIVSDALAKCFPNAPALINLVTTQTHHLAEIGIRSAFRIFLCPFSRTFADHPVALANRITSDRNKMFFRFSYHVGLRTGN